MREDSSISYAIIHVGSSTMSLTIVEYRGLTDIRTVESATREVAYGEELFQTKQISFDTIREMCRVLKGFKDIMTAYGVTEYTAVATSVIREAKNRRHILDQINVQTGLEIKVLEMPQEIYIKYFALYNKLKSLGIDHEDSTTLFLDVTSGGLGLALWQGGDLKYQQNMHIGTIRILEGFSRNQRSTFTFSKAISELLQSRLSPIMSDLNEFNISCLILSGEEALWLANMMGIEATGDNVRIDATKFNEFYEAFDGITPTKLVTRYNIPENRANILMPLMIIYYELIKMIKVKTISINNTKFRDAVVVYHGAKATNAPYLQRIRWQTLALAKSIASKYHYDINHSSQIAKFGEKIITAISENAGLPEISLFLFEFIAIMVDIGKHINMRSHNEHSYNIIKGTDFFGLTESQREIVANVVYYGTISDPMEEDYNFKQLTENQKMMVIKLLAILRVAEALDKSHLQKIKDIDIVWIDDLIEIIAYSKQNIALERWSFEAQSRYFSDIFGIEIEVTQERGDRL